MTDGPTDGDLAASGLTADEELAVTRMLAEAAGPESMPDEVAARLQEVLDDLEAERSAGTGEGATPQRARRWPRALLAAAAVLLVGYGVGSVASHMSLSGSGADSTADSSVAGSATSEEAPEAVAVGLDGGGGATDRQLGAELGRIPPHLRSERLDVGVRRALRVLDAQQADGALFSDRSTACRPPSPVERSDWLLVRYDGRPAVLVRRSAAADLVEVTVYACRGGTKLDRTVLQGG